MPTNNTKSSTIFHWTAKAKTKAQNIDSSQFVMKAPVQRTKSDSQKTQFPNLRYSLRQKAAFGVVDGVAIVLAVRPVKAHDCLDCNAALRRAR